MVYMLDYDVQYLVQYFLLGESAFTSLKFENASWDFLQVKVLSIIASMSDLM